MTISSTEIIWGSITFLFAFLLYYYITRVKLWNMVNKIPGPPTLPIIGNAWDLFVDHSEVINLFWKFTKACPKYFRIWVLGYPYLALFRAADVEVLLSGTVNIEKSSDYKYLHPWLGTGLLTSNGSKWHTRRKLLTPSFHFRILEDFIGVFNEQSKILTEKLMKVTDKKSCDIFPLITMCTLDVICESVMGCHVSAQENSESEYVKALDKIKDIIHSRQFRFLLWPDWLFNLTPYGWEHNKCLKILHEFTDKVIQERKLKWKSESKPNGFQNQDSVICRKTRLAFLDLLIEASDEGRQLSDLDIREEVDTFMFEGHDTTAAAISWSIFALAVWPHFQKKVHEELDSIFGDDRTSPITTEHIKQMKYLECVIKEALRSCPSVPLIARTIKEDIVIDGYTVPAGVNALVIVPMLHRDPDMFPDPESFKPDRFLPENSLNRHPYSYIPFSAGSRNCIGQRFALMEEKVILAWILRSFTIKSRQNLEELEVVAELILKPKNGIIVNLTPR